MDLVILTPGKTVYEGNVTAVNTPGKDGKIEILNNHAPIVAALGEGEITVTTASQEKLSFNTTGGFLEVLSNKISILLESVK